MPPVDTSGEPVYLTREEMAQHCPSCAEQMAAKNISRIALRDAKAWSAYAQRNSQEICSSLWTRGSDAHRAAFGAAPGTYAGATAPDDWTNSCLASVGAGDALQRGISDAAGQVAPPRNFHADQSPDGTWNVRGVPVFVEHVVRDKGGQTYRVDGDWMRSAVERSQARYRQDGYLGPLHENHHGRGRPVQLLGKYLLTGVKRMPYQGQPRHVAFADYLGLAQATYERLKRGGLPYRSAEVLSLGAKELDSIALLADEVPFFRLAPHAIGEERPYAAAEPRRFAADLFPLVAYRATGAHAYSLLMRYDDMPGQEPVVDLTKDDDQIEKKPEQSQDDGKGGLVSILSELARLIQEAIDAANAGGAPKSEPSAGPAPVEPLEATSAMRSATTLPNTTALYALQARVDAGEAKYAALAKMLEDERASKARTSEVDKVFADLQRYGFGELKHRQRLQTIADKDGLPALMTYAAAIKEYAMESPPVFESIGGSIRSTRPEISRPDAQAERYAALGSDAAELAYKAGRSFDDLKAKGMSLDMSRDEFIRTTLTDEGGYDLAAVAAANGRG